MINVKINFTFQNLHLFGEALWHSNKRKKRLYHLLYHPILPTHLYHNTVAAQQLLPPLKSCLNAAKNSSSPTPITPSPP